MRHTTKKTKAITTKTTTRLVGRTIEDDETLPFDADDASDASNDDDNGDSHQLNSNNTSTNTKKSPMASTSASSSPKNARRRDRLFTASTFSSSSSSGSSKKRKLRQAFFSDLNDNDSDDDDDDDEDENGDNDFVDSDEEDEEDDNDLDDDMSSDDNDDDDDVKRDKHLKSEKTSKTSKSETTTDKAAPQSSLMRNRRPDSGVKFAHDVVEIYEAANVDHAKGKKRVVKLRKRLTTTNNADHDNDDNDDNDDDNEGTNNTTDENDNEDDDDDDEETKARYFAQAPDLDTNVTFDELHLSRPLLKAVDQLNYRHPTPIQAKSIPILLQGHDLCGSAVTGSGKTAAFMLPILERLLYRPRRVLATRVLVLTPTRELATQILAMTEKLAQFSDIRSCLVVGGLNMHDQEAALRTRPDIVIATPGRLIDHMLNTQAFGLDDLEILVLDEADRLLDLGFDDQIEELIKNCPIDRQTILFSATMTEKVDKLARLSLKHPVRVSADPKNDVSPTLSQEFVRIHAGKEHDKEAILLALCARTFQTRCIVFTNHKKSVHRLKLLFAVSGLKASELHGDLSQGLRLAALERFRKQQVDFLLCTDIAARGLDIKGVHFVINFDMPHDIKTYVHRVGRTARAGERGTSVSLVCMGDNPSRALMRSIVKQALSNSETVKSRTIPQNAVEFWKNHIRNSEMQVTEIKQGENEEAQLREAEREIDKASYLLENAGNKAPRPKREWYQSQKDKKSSRDKSSKEFHQRQKARFSS